MSTIQIQKILALMPEITGWIDATLAAHECKVPARSKAAYYFENCSCLKKSKFVKLMLFAV